MNDDFLEPQARSTAFRTGMGVRQGGRGREGGQRGQASDSLAVNSSGSSVRQFGCECTSSLWQTHSPVEFSLSHSFAMSCLPRARKNSQEWRARCVPCCQGEKRAVMVVVVVVNCSFCGAHSSCTPLTLSYSRGQLGMGPDVFSTGSCLQTCCLLMAPVQRGRDHSRPGW